MESCQVGFAPAFFIFRVMIENSSIVEFITAATVEAVGEGPIELVHIELAGNKRDRIVRIYIDKEGGVTIEDCTNISRAIEERLDEADVIPGSYVLEVSSPGIERELYKTSDFERFIGEVAKVKLKDAIGEQKTLTGKILTVNGETISIDDRTAGEIEFKFGNVAKANLKIDLAKEFGTK